MCSSDLGHKAVCLWLPGQGQADSLLRQVLHRYPTTLAGLLLLLAVLIWQRQGRLHPPLPLPEPARRDVLAYFTGAGRFAWRINRAARLLADNQESLARELINIIVAEEANQGGLSIIISPELGNLAVVVNRNDLAGLTTIHLLTQINDSPTVTQ